MKLTVVGCAGSFPSAQSPASSYLVEHDGQRIVLDMGNGALGSLQRFTDIYQIDAVVLSHLHIDHFVDLGSYYVARKYHPEGSAGPIPVYGPDDTAARVVAAYGLQSTADIAGELDVRPLAAKFEIGAFTIETTRMVHPIEAYAIRVSADGRSLTYSGDTGPTPELITAARDTNLALFEGSFVTDPSNPRDLHLSAAEAGAHARAAGAERLVVTHLVPWNDQEQVHAEAVAEFPGAQVASVGLTIEV
ncbi:MAG: MBL fold metallo-hydrolase [Actinomycetia bacterium]|nr:MBL fold metallo-hydrolase [Actinomycetes bacterium]